MNIRQLEAFHAVMETGSVTLAGERLGVSQPAVSKLLKALTEGCGFQLFHRSAGRMIPTLEARLLSVEVERMFAGTGRVASVAQAIRNREIGHVTLAAFPALCARYLPRLLSPFIRQQPDLHLVLRSSNSYRIADLVAARQVDLGLSLMPYDDPAVRSEVVASFSMVCFLPRAHPLAEKNVIEIADLKDESFVSLERDDCAIMTIDRAFQASGVQKRTRIEVPMSEAACGFVASGAGVSILPPFIGLDIDDGSIVRRPLLPDTAMDIWLLQPQQARNSAAEMMAGYLREALAAPAGARPAA